MSEYFIILVYGVWVFVSPHSTVLGDTLVHVVLLQPLHLCPSHCLAHASRSFPHSVVVPSLAHLCTHAPEDIWNEDETGTFWKALPTTSLAEKGKRCQGGKNAKQRITAAFFVNAAGAKESPILIGKNQKPRCFTKLQDISRPCGAQYFNNDKAWMRTEIMANVLTKLNSKMKRENRHIILFLDNASCHLSSLKGMFSNVQIEFLPKNTTSRTQPLDAGIIKTWKMYYKRKLLRHVASEIDGKKTASEIVKSVNLLMAIRWMVSAWEEVPSEVISKCFKHVGMYPDEEMEMDDDPFAGEELLEIELSHLSRSRRIFRRCRG